MTASTNRQPKLRDSCDHCSNSKVRCDKGKPSCRRCNEKGFACEYSPARRIGRVRSKTLKSINDDVKYRLPKGDIPSACSSPPGLMEEMESSPELNAPSSPEFKTSPEFKASPGADWNDPWSLPPVPQHQQQQQLWDQKHVFGMRQQRLPSGLINSVQPFTPTNMDQATLVPSTCVLPQLIQEGAFVPMSASVTDSPFGPNAMMANTLQSPPMAPTLQSPPMPTIPEPSIQHRTSTSTSNPDDFMPPMTHSYSTSTSTSSSSGNNNIDAGFSTLLNFTDNIESKFDVFVRRRLSLDEGIEAEPNQGEKEFYHSLAELKRRVKWLREDVRNS